MHSAHEQARQKGTHDALPLIWPGFSIGLSDDFVASGLSAAASTGFTAEFSASAAGAGAAGVAGAGAGSAFGLGFGLGS